MATSSVSDLDQDSLNVMFHDGGTLVFLDVPPGTMFGIDYNTWHVGDKFRGVKMIPPGLHFIYYSACSKEGNVGPRTGFFHFFKHREVLVKKWDKHTEDIKLETVSEEELERFKSNKEDLDRFLGAYPYENFKKWLSLTSHISEGLIQQIQPLSGKISSVTQFISESSTTKSRQEAAQSSSHSDQDKDDKRLPRLNIAENTEIRFTPILQKHEYPTGASAAEITKYSMDSSYKLLTLLNDAYKQNQFDLLGEVQFAFLCFLIGQVYDAFEQWKTLVHLLCTCDEALVSHSELFLKFISVLHFQVREIPEDFFIDIVSSNNFLTTTLQEFFSNLENCDADAAAPLRKRGLAFRDHLQKKFHWDFTSEPDDYAPVIVE